MPEYVKQSTKEKNHDWEIPSDMINESVKDVKELLLGIF